MRAEAARCSTGRSRTLRQGVEHAGDGIERPGAGPEAVSGQVRGKSEEGRSARQDRTRHKRGFSPPFCRRAKRKLPGAKSRASPISGGRRKKKPRRCGDGLKAIFVAPRLQNLPAQEVRSDPGRPRPIFIRLGGAFPVPPPPMVEQTVSAASDGSRRGRTEKLPVWQRAETWAHCRACSTVRLPSRTRWAELWMGDRARRGSRKLREYYLQPRPPIGAWERGRPWGQLDQDAAQRGKASRP